MSKPNLVARKSKLSLGKAEKRLLDLRLVSKEFHSRSTQYQLMTSSIRCSLILTICRMTPSELVRVLQKKYSNEEILEIIRDRSSEFAEIDGYKLILEGSPLDLLRVQVLQTGPMSLYVLKPSDFTQTSSRK